MLKLIDVLLFEHLSRDPVRTTAVINTGDVVTVVPAGWEVTRWVNGKPCVKIALRNEEPMYAPGRPEDFAEAGQGGD